MTIAFRDARPEDEADWRRLWQGFLDHYAEKLDPRVIETTWARILDPDHGLNCRLALLDGQVAGLAHWHPQIGTWLLKDDLYLEDLFIDPACRGRGLGRAMMEDLAEVGRARGLGRLCWNTEIDNDRARALYETLAPWDGLIRYRMPL